MSHTPGPWFDDGYRIYAPTVTADKRDGRVIVDYKHVDEFNLADARLIAAAPELLAAVKGLLHLYEQLGSPDFNAAMVAFYDAHAAIEKAEAAHV